MVYHFFAMTYEVSSLVNDQFTTGFIIVEYCQPTKSKALRIAR